MQTLLILSEPEENVKVSGFSLKIPTHPHLALTNQPPDGGGLVAEYLDFQFMPSRYFSLVSFLSYKIG